MTSWSYVAVIEGIVKKIYSYSRVSSAQQIDGFGLSRQKDNADDYAAKFGYQLEELIDDGVSGFKNDKNNLTHGELGAFIANCESGNIQRGSILLIENLDRLGRHGISKTQLVVNTLITHGIAIHVWDGTSGKADIYDNKTINEIAGAVLLAVYADGAYKQSLDKQNRAKSNWKKKREAARDEGKLISTNVPSWFDIDDGKIVLTETNKDLINRIIEMYLDGNGVSAIVRKLTIDGTTSYTDHWNTTNLAGLLRSPSLIGDAYLKRSNVTIKGYYPRIISDELYNRIRLVRKQRELTKTGGSRKSTANLFRGLVVCGGCKGTVSTFSSAGNKVLRCPNPLCKLGGWKINLFEECFFDNARHIDYSIIFSSVSDAVRIQNKIDASAGKLTDLDDQIKRAVTLLIKFSDMEEVESQLNDLQVEREALLESIESFQKSQNDIKTIDTNIDYNVSSMTDGQRMVLRNKLPTFIDHIIMNCEPRKKNNEGKLMWIVWKNGKVTMWKWLDPKLSQGNWDKGIAEASKIYDIDPITGEIFGYK